MIASFQAIEAIEMNANSVTVGMLAWQRGIFEAPVYFQHVILRGLEKK